MENCSCARVRIIFFQLSQETVYVHRLVLSAAI